MYSCWDRVCNRQMDRRMDRQTDGKSYKEELPLHYLVLFIIELLVIFIFS